MRTKQRENIQAVTSFLILITFIIFAAGFAYQKQIVMLIGMFGLGLTLLIHAPLSLITLSLWQNDGLKTRLAYWGETFFAIGQLIFGILAIFGFAADVFTDYLTSGRFWKQISNYPFLFIFSFGLFCSFVGISQIAANLKTDGEKLSDKLRSIQDILQGIVFLLFGLVFIGLILFVKLF